MSHCLLTLLVAVVLTLVGGRGASAQEETSDQKGVIPEHGSFSALPWEHIDTYTGNLVLSFADLVLPGNAGFSLVVRRTFNSSSSEWQWEVGPRFFVNSSFPLTYPVVRSPDGRDVYFLKTPSGDYVSTGFWRVTGSASQPRLEMPNGIVWYFDAEGRGVRMEDPFGNGVDVTWSGSLMVGVVQHVGDRTRTVSFTYDEDGRISTLTYNGRTWSYIWGPIQTNTGYETEGLIRVQPPVGPAWQFAQTIRREIVSWSCYSVEIGTWGTCSDFWWERTLQVTTPTGGVVKYTVADGDRGPGYYEGQYGAGQMLRTRETWGPGVTPGTWTFGYVHHFAPDPTPWLGDFSETTITGPDNWRARHTHADVWEGGWVPAVHEMQIGSPTGWLETIQVDWRLGVRLGDPEPGIWNDAYAILPTEVRTTRDGHQYTRTFSYDDDFFNHFGQPTVITDTGDFTRTTTLTYRHFAGATWLADRVATETVDGLAVSAFTYADTGFLLAKTVLGVTTSYTPDAHGNVASQTDANNHTTTFDYDWGAVTAVHTPAYTVEYGLNPDGTLAWARQNGHTTTFTYDDLGRQTSVQPPVGHATTTSYASDGSSVTTTRGPSSVVSFLDGFGRVTTTRNSVNVQTTASYNALGLVTAASYPHVGSGPQTTFTYDALGRVTRKEHPDGAAVTYAYDGLTASLTDEEGRVTTQVWEASGTPTGARLRAVTDAEGHTTSYSYNTFGSLTHVESPGSVVRTWSYDGQNRLTSQTQPELGTITYDAYDAVGNLRKMTDASGGVTWYVYDANNRLTDVQPYKANGDPNGPYWTHLTYDAANNRTSLANGYVTSTFAYDAANRLTQRTDVINGRPFVTQFTPDGNGNVADILYPSGNHVAYWYDSENRVVRVFDNAGGLEFARNFSYHPSGGLAGYISGDGNVHTITYDARYRPQSLVAQNLLDLTYAYDRVGNVTSLTDTRPGMSVTFAYDALDRLTAATGGGWGTLGYTYDPVGNRTSQTVNGTATTYGYTSQRLTSTSGGRAEGFAYDSVGNLTQDGTGTYTYTPANLLETATVAGGTAVYTYRYDGDGQRVMRIAGSGSQTTYYIRGLGELLSEFEETPTGPAWVRDYLYAGSRLVASTRPSAAMPTSPLSVTKSGAGSEAALVSSAPVGVICGPVCSATFEAGATVTLTAQPPAGFAFVGWTGDGCATGTVVMSQARTCTATFRLEAAKLTPATGATGQGSTVVTTWTAVPESGYWVCLDSTDNATCDTMWWPNGGSTMKEWTGLAPGTYSWQVRVETPAGTFEADNGTWWSFTVAPASIPADHWTAEYFSNTGLQGAPVQTVDEGTGFIDHAWGGGGPAGLPSDDFSARFTRTVTFAGGRYRFTIVTDDGSRLWIDNQVKIDAWWDQAPTMYAVDVDLSAGAHVVRYDFYEHGGGAVAQLLWAQLPLVTLASGETLYPNEARTSADGQYTLVYQGDGNLVVYRQNGTDAWSSGTQSTNGGFARMQGDGNLVVYNGDEVALWHAGTYGHDGAYLQIANDEMVIYAVDGTRVWWAPLAAGLAGGGGGGPGSWPGRLAAVGLWALAGVAGVGLRGIRRWRRRPVGRPSRARVGAPAGRWGMRRVAWLLPLVVLLAPPVLGGQGSGGDNQPQCGYLVQGYVQLPDGTPLPKAVVEELVEPHRTPAFRVRTNRRGWFEMGYGRRKKGALVLLRITAPGGPVALVKLKIDPGCGVPVFVIPAGPPK